MSSHPIQRSPRLDAMVSIKTHIPEDAMSATLLGTERTGHGVRIREDGLIATIGYVINEAESVWIGSADGTIVPGFVVGYDFDSGFGLVMPTMPPHDSWSGAALVDGLGRLCGLGSLVIQGFELDGETHTVNMFVPIDLLTPIVDEICRHGRRAGPQKPWLGVLVHEDQDDRLTIVGVYRNCPADKAGLKPGDVIVRIDDSPVRGLANMFRRVWDLGDAGVEVPIRVLRDNETIDRLVASDDRVIFQRIGTVQ
jgi:S1-C subfamily serine protease